MEDKKTHKKVGIGIVAGLASISMLLSGIFDSSKDLLADLPENNEIPKPDNALYVNEAKAVYKQSGIRERAVRMVYKVPVRIRAVLFVPFWAIGNLLLAAIEAAFSTLIAPIAHLLLGFVLQTLLLFLVIGVCIKILFPDLPWSKIFSKKLSLSVFLGSIFMSICDQIVPRYWPDYGFYRDLARFLLGLLVILIILKPFIRKKLKDRVSYQIEYDGEIVG